MLAEISNLDLKYQEYGDEAIDCSTIVVDFAIAAEV